MPTPQQRQFVEEYFVDMDAKAAYERAGYSMTATGGPAKLLKSPWVSQEIAKRMARSLKKIELTGDQIRAGVARIALNPKEPSRVRLQAFVELAKMGGLYRPQQIEIKGSLTLVELLLAANRAHESQDSAPVSVIEQREVASIEYPADEVA